MKKLKPFFLTALLMIIGLTTTEAKNSELFSKNYKVKSFSSVHTNTIADIVYTQSDKISVKAEGAKEIVDNLKINVRNGVLTIENDRELNDKNDKPIVVFVSSPTIQSIETCGIGNLCLKGAVIVDNLDIKAEGIGNVHALDLKCKKVHINYKGIGNLTLAGETDIVEINSSGIGNIDCHNLLAKTTMVKSTKTGKVDCFASESIGLFNDGIGEISYSGNPTFKNLQNGGMGKIKEVK